MLLPRADLSSPAREVLEFRLKAHDGTKLWGLIARSTLRLGEQPARIRLIGPCELPEVDRDAVSQGIADFVLQEPAGRRLEDRVLDVMRLCQVAQTTEGVDPERVTFETADSCQPDEFLIASRLLADGFSC